MDFKKINSVVYFDTDTGVFIEDNNEFYNAARAYGVPVIYVGDQNPISAEGFYDSDEYYYLNKVYREEDDDIDEFLSNILENSFDEDILNYLDYLTYEDIYNFDPSLFDEAYKNMEEVIDYYYDFEAFIKEGFVHYTAIGSGFADMQRKYDEYCLSNTIKKLANYMLPNKKNNIIMKLKRKYT